VVAVRLKALIVPSWGRAGCDLPVIESQSPEPGSGSEIAFHPASVEDLVRRARSVMLFVFGVVCVVGFLAVVFILLTSEDFLDWLLSSRPRGLGYQGDPRELWQMHNQEPEDEWGVTEDDIDDLGQWKQEQQEELNRAMWMKAQREVEARRKKRKEQEDIAASFPGWLIDFGQELGLERFTDLSNLTQYIGAIMSYADENFEGELSIKRTYRVVAEGDGFGSPPPNDQCKGRVFFEDLSKILAENGLLREARGRRGRRLEDGALTTFASSVQAVSVHRQNLVTGYSSENGQTRKTDTATQRDTDIEIISETDN